MWTWVRSRFLGDRLPIVAFVSAMLVTLLTISILHLKVSELESIQRQLDTEVASLEQKQRETEEAIELYQQLEPVYRKAEKNGWWRRQDRLAWMEQVDPSARQVGMASLNYELSPPRDFFQADDFSVQAVAVELEMGLVHGAQLLEFDQALAETGLGPFSWEQCRIERRRIRARPEESNVSALCRLEWFALVQQVEEGNDPDGSPDGGVPPS